jgi:hypothetical protein
MLADKPDGSHDLASSSVISRLCASAPAWPHFTPEPSQAAPPAPHDHFLLMRFDEAARSIQVSFVEKLPASHQVYAPFAVLRSATA